MTVDEYVSVFFPGMTVDSLYSFLVDRGYREDSAYEMTIAAMRCGALGRKPYPTLKENIIAYGVCVAYLIQTVQEVGITKTSQTTEEIVGMRIEP